MITRNKEKGFTLIEIAIVLVIIGLLVGGVLKGQELITNSKIKSLSEDMLDIKTAYYAYKDRTGKYPVPHNAEMNDFQYHDPIFWQNLREEGFISSGDPTLDDNYLFTGPKYALGSQFIFFGDMSPYLPIDNNQYFCAFQVSVKYARGIDLKLDDGLPSKGHIKSIPMPTWVMKNNYDDFPSQEAMILFCMSLS